MVRIFWGIPIAPLSENERKVCTDSLNFRDYPAYLKRIEGNVHVCLTDTVFSLDGPEDEIEPAFYKMKGVFEENNIHLKETGLRDVVYCETVMMQINMAAFAQKHGFQPAVVIEIKIGDARVSFSTNAFFIIWRGRIDLEAVKAQALAML